MSVPVSVQKDRWGVQYQEKVACKIIMSCMVLHNYCRDRNLDYGVDADVAEMMRRERGISVTCRHNEEGDKEILKHGQIARSAIVNSF